MEEIDIIELLKRVKEGKAPKEIEIKNSTYIKSNDPDTDDIVYMYKGYSDYWLEDLEITLDTKIKILDKPIIEELSKDDMLYGYIMGNKINYKIYK